MSETLTIKNFGPIKSVKLELKRFNILIGENATGKSTVAKLLAVCRYFSYIVGNSRISFSKDTNSFFQGLASWGMIEFLKVDTYIEYQCTDYIFKVESNNSTMISKVAEDSSVTYSSAKNKSWNISLEEKSARFANLLKELKKLQSSTKDQLNDPGLSWIPTSFYQNDVASVLDNPFYLPTERGLQSIFSLGKSSIPNISDSLYNQFSTLDLIARNFNNETLIEPFNIIYKNEDGRGFVKKDIDQNFYNLSNGASGYKSTIPIVLVVKYYNQIRKKKKIFLIEEPELNLFPKAQNELMKFLVDNIINYKNSVLIATHSPYILTSLNNMMYAYKVGENNAKATEKKIKRKYWINPDDVSAYLFLSSGKFKNILDKEGLIKAEMIDGVSRELNKDFNALMDIELKIK